MSPGSKWLLSQETLGVQKRTQQAVAVPPKAPVGSLTLTLTLTPTLTLTLTLTPNPLP